MYSTEAWFGKASFRMASTSEFQKFYSSVSLAAERQRQNSAHFDNVAAACWLSQHKRKAEASEKVRPHEPTLAEVVAATAGRVPKTFKSGLQRALYDTPSARQEAEEAERLRWLQALALLVERSPTPMGNLLARQPGSLALLGAGRRAATLRNRVRLLRNFFSWLTATHEVRYPTSLEHFVGFLRARASEPANRGALRNVNRTFTFLHEVTGTEQVDRLTATPLYDAVYKEILTSCEPGKPVKQAPRFPVGLLALVENFVMTDSNPAYMRMYGWWVLLQSWGTMRFSDHRGLSPADISFADGSLTGLLRRTKTTGTDKNVSARPVRVDASSFISTPQWLSVGWQILCELAPFKRDYLLPAPAGAYDSCLRTELRYALGYAIQNRLLARLVDDKGATVLTAEATMFWTPHSGRSFLPSCTQALGFPKEERDFLGGWSPRERHLREDGEAPHLFDAEVCFEGHCPGPRR